MSEIRIQVLECILKDLREALLEPCSCVEWSLCRVTSLASCKGFSTRCLTSKLNVGPYIGIKHQLHTAVHDTRSSLDGSLCHADERSAVSEEAIGRFPRAVRNRGEVPPGAVPKVNIREPA